MRKFIFTLFLLSCNASFCQTVPNFDQIKLDKVADYKSAEVSALQAANYVLTTPIEEKDRNRLQSLAFIIKWMSGTPDFSFTLDNSISKVIKGNDDLLGLYMACMTKYVLENKASSKDEKAVKLNAVKLLLAYCENPANNIKLTKRLKKLSEANQKGELEKEL